MLNKITQFFQSLHQVEEEQAKQHLTIELACTVLLCEVMRADGLLDADEKVVLSQLIQQRFNLSGQEAEILISKAIDLCEHATDFHQFTSIVNQSYGASEKTHIVSLLWQLAHADGHVASVEEHTIRRIADLLHLRHSEYISAKTSVVESEAKS